MSAGVPVLLLGGLILLGSVATVLIAPFTPRSTVPACCRRRVDAFAAFARLNIAAGALLAVVGVVLLAVGEG
jgi:hypothetical protein